MVPYGNPAQTCMVPDLLTTRSSAQFIKSFFIFFINEGKWLQKIALPRYEYLNMVCVVTLKIMKAKIGSMFSKIKTISSSYKNLSWAMFNTVYRLYITHNCYWTKGASNMESVAKTVAYNLYICFLAWHNELASKFSILREVSELILS